MLKNYIPRLKIILKVLTVANPGFNINGLHYGRLVKSDENVMLVDEARNKYPIESVLFLNRFFNPQEGDIEYPRVWEGITEKIKETTGSTAEKEGDIVVFAFAGGRVTYPVVLGSISQSNLFGDKYRADFSGFLDMQEARHLIKANIKRKIEYNEDKSGNIEKTITTYEDIANEGDPQEERGAVHFSVTKEGEVIIDITEIKDKTGTGNITLDIKGNDGQTNGNINLNFNGKLNLVNTDDDGAPTGTKLTIDNTIGAERIDFEDINGNKINITVDGMEMTDLNGNIYTMDSGGITLMNKDGKKIIMSGAGTEINSGGTAEKMILGEKLDDFLSAFMTAMQEVMTALQSATYVMPAIPAAPSPLVVVPAGYVAAKAQADAKKSLILSTSNKND